jgi:uncharacterized membrane protein
VLLFVAYALFAHLSVLRETPWLELVSFSALSAGMLYPALRAGKAGAWLGLAAVAAACAGLIGLDDGRYVTYLPSVALPAAALAGFAGSLLPGRTALITLIASSVHGELPPHLTAHTRLMTWLWALLTAAVLMIDVVLILRGPRWLWSEFANLYIYGILGVAFLVEYLYERLRFEEIRDLDFISYLRVVARQRPGAA